MKNQQSDTQNMISKYEAKNKQEDKKHFKLFIIIMVICFIMGVGAGKLTRIIENNLESIREVMEQLDVVLAYVMPSLFLLIDIVSFILILGRIRSQEKRLKKWDGEDEEILDDIDKKLDLPLYSTYILQILGIFLFAVCVHIDLAVEIPKLHENIMFWIVMIDFIADLIICTIAQKRIINLSKLMNPEKNGSIFDVNFGKKWEQSCDEAQKAIMYKASYKAFKILNTLCSCLWVVCFIADFAFHTGLFPIVLVLLIWLTETIVYTKETMRLERGSK